MKKKLTCLLLTLILAAAFAIPAFAWSGFEYTSMRVRDYDDRFEDVTPADWFYDNVSDAYRLGLVNGTSENAYSPYSNFTIAQAIALACNLSTRHTGETIAQIEGPAWQQPYLDYALENGIIKEGEFPKTGKLASRTEFAVILSRALPSEAYSPINMISGGDIWDVPAEMDGAVEIYTLYNAGIITGNDKYGTFYPQNPIKRSEGAVIASRVADPSLRARFTPEEKPVPETPKTYGTITKKSGHTYFMPTGSKYTFDATGTQNQPYLVAVNRQCCTVTVYGKDAAGDYTVPVKAMACSMGREGHTTPTGRWTTTDKYEWRLMIDGTYGRYAIRFAPGGYLFHSVPYYSINKGDLEWQEFNKLGTPASLGCVRLCVADIKWLYDNCPKGFTTIVYDDPNPGPLGKPEAARMDDTDEARRGWDPTDPDPNNPWNK